MLLSREATINLREKQGIFTEHLLLTEASPLCRAAQGLRWAVAAGNGLQGTWFLHGDRTIKAIPKVFFPCAPTCPFALSSQQQPMGRRGRASCWKTHSDPWDSLLRHPACVSPFLSSLRQWLPSCEAAVML